MQRWGLSPFTLPGGHAVGADRESGGASTRFQAAVGAHGEVGQLLSCAIQRKESATIRGDRHVDGTGAGGPADAGSQQFS